MWNLRRHYRHEHEPFKPELSVLFIRTFGELQYLQKGSVPNALYQSQCHCIQRRQQATALRGFPFTMFPNCIDCCSIPWIRDRPVAGPTSTTCNGIRTHVRVRAVWDSMLCDQPIIIPSSGTYITDREMPSAYVKRPQFENMLLIISATNQVPLLHQTS
jgi:hypothetical protein